MCVRYVGTDARNSRWGLAPKTATERRILTTGELFPGETGAIVKNGGEVVEARWGLQPHWAKEATFGRKNAYNARSETLAEKPTFRVALKHRRCVLPAAAFYERADGRWLRILPKQGDLFLFAGLWEPENEHTEGLPTYTMVTTEPNDLVAKVHDRMPVILTPDDAEHWMDPDADLADLRALLLPAPAEGMSFEDAGPVSHGKRPTKKKDEEPRLLDA